VMNISDIQADSRVQSPPEPRFRSFPPSVVAEKNFCDIKSAGAGFLRGSIGPGDFPGVWHLDTATTVRGAGVSTA